MQRVAFYTRISTDEDHQKYSLDAQRGRLQAHASALYGDDWRLVGVYTDQESGTHMRRPGLGSLLADAEARKFDVVLVFRVDRLSRKVHELARMVDELGKWNVALKSITEPFDTTNLAGKMMMQMLGVFAEFEHGTIIERTKVGMEKKAQTGRWVGGAVPYGYRFDHEKKQIVVHEEEAAFVRKLFATYATDRPGVWSLRDQFTAMGFRKRSGRPWDRRVLLHMLRNPVYIGKIRWVGAIYDGTHEPIVSEELFGRVQEILIGRSESIRGRMWANCRDRILTGVIRCARCDGGMVGVSTRKKGRKHSYYACLTREREKKCPQEYVRADELESIVLGDVRQIFRDDVFVDQVWEETNRRLAEVQPDLEKERQALLAEHERVLAKIDRYTAAFENGTLEAGLFGENVRALKVQLQELDAHRRDLEAEAANLKLPQLDRDHILALLDDFETVFVSGTNPQKKHLLHQVVKEVRVLGKLSVEVTYFVPQPHLRVPTVSRSPGAGLLDSHIWLLR